MDAAEYKHVVLGLIFLKYISDAFEEQHAKLVADKVSGADLEDANEYRAQSIFWVPPEARWQYLKAQACQPMIGQLVDDAMAGIERDNCWSRCSSRIAAGYTTRAAAPRACSCSRWSSSARTPRGNGNGGKAKVDISIYGQESNYTTWRLAKMNLAIRGIDGQIARRSVGLGLPRSLRSFGAGERGRSTSRPDSPREGK